MTRTEHLNWCKKRALELLDQGNTRDAVLSMLSDLQKHPETCPIDPTIGMMGVVSIKVGKDAVREFITGF